MDAKNLNEWGAKIMGEEGEEAGFAIESEIFTQSIGAALVVASAMAEDGKDVEIKLSKSGVEVEVGEAEVSGEWSNAAMVIMQACYNCAHGYTEEAEDDDDT